MPLATLYKYDDVHNEITATSSSPILKQQKKKMASLSFKAAAAVLVAVAVVAQLQAARFAADQKEFDYFVLSLQWPGNSCRNISVCCQENACCAGADTPKEFTIHGLWPEYEWNGWPQCCTDAIFNENEINPLIDSLDKYWPTYRCGSEPTCSDRTGNFWAQQYEKHGTCAAPVINSQLEYFNTTLELFSKYNVNKALQNAKIVASDTATYPKDDVIQVVTTVLQGGKPEIRCAEEGIVKEVWLCYDKRFVPRSCDPIPVTCPDSVKFPIAPTRGPCAVNGALSWM